MILNFILKKISNLLNYQYRLISIYKNYIRNACFCQEAFGSLLTLSYLYRAIHYLHT